MKNQLNIVKNNIIGGIACAAAGFYLAKKYGKVENKLALAGIAVAGLVVGANLQSKVVAIKSRPTATSTKK